MGQQKTTAKMRRLSVQMPETLLAGLQDLADREGQDLQPMLRELLQRAVDGDDPGRVVSASTREAIDALTDEQRQTAASWQAGVETILDALKEKQGVESAGWEVATQVIYSLRDDLDRDREIHVAEWKDTQEAVGAQKESLDQVKAAVDEILDLQKPPAPDETRRRLRIPKFGGGG